MLATSPNFTEWDENLAQRLNIQIPKENDVKPSWEEILEEACSTDEYLEQHFNDIRSLLLLVQQHTIENGNTRDVSFEERIRSIIDKSSVTGVSEPSHSVEVDQKRMIAKLHHTVFHRIKEKRKDIETRVRDKGLALLNFYWLSWILVNTRQHKTHLTVN